MNTTLENTQTRKPKTRAIRWLATGIVAGSLFLTSHYSLATNSPEGLQQIQKQWAVALYNNTTKQAKQKALEKVSEQSTALVSRHPNDAELLTWNGIILSTLAGVKGGLGALSLAKQARNQLEKARGINPNVLNGSVYSTLATLYAKVPAWPIGFGNKKLADQYYQKALQINPHGIDPNYFYADYLAENGHEATAVLYAQKALQAPARPNRPLADSGRRQEAQQLLNRLKAAGH